MKKLFMIGMSIILCMVLMAIPVSAAYTEGTAAVSSATGERGDTVYLTVSLSDFPEASSIGITWEGLSPEIESCEWLLSDATLEHIDSDGAIWAVETSADLNGDVLKLAFVVPAEDDGNTVYSVTVTVNVYTATEEPNPVTATGYVRLSCEHTNLTEFPAVASSCTQQGNNQYFQCTNCLVYLAADKVTTTEPKQQLLPLADHDFQWVIDQKATDLAPGQKHEACTNCPETRNENTPIAILPHTHTPVHVKATAATCTKSGTIEHWICNSAKCAGKYYADSNCSKRATDIVIPNLGHSYGDWVMVKKPSTTEEGLEVRTCGRCGDEEEKVIEKLVNPFTDVPEGSFYYAPVLWAVENGVTSGTSPTAFSPLDPCLRAHVVTFLHRAAGNPAPSSTNNPFTDVASGAFFYKPVLWAVENSVTNGTSATTFGSYDNCNRAAVVTFLWRAAGSPDPKSTNNPFVDVATTAFYYKAVLWAVEKGITNGVDTTHFGPTQSCNRAQVVTFLYRAQ